MSNRLPFVFKIGKQPKTGFEMTHSNVPTYPIHGSKHLRKAASRKARSAFFKTSIGVCLLLVFLVYFRDIGYYSST